VPLPVVRSSNPRHKQQGTGTASRIFQIAKTGAALRRGRLGKRRHPPNGLAGDSTKWQEPRTPPGKVGAGMNQPEVQFVTAPRPTVSDQNHRNEASPDRPITGTDYIGVGHASHLLARGSQTAPTAKSAESPPPARQRVTRQ